MRLRGEARNDGWVEIKKPLRKERLKFVEIASSAYGLLAITRLLNGDFHHFVTHFNLLYSFHALRHLTEYSVLIV